MENSSMWLNALIPLIATPAVTSFVAFCFRERIKGFITVDSQKAINEHKQILDTYTESMKHSLQRELVRVETYLKSKFNIYPVLYEKIVKAHVSITDLHEQKTFVEWTLFTESEIYRYFQSKKISESEINRVLKLSDKNKKNDIDQLYNLLREAELEEANRLYREAKNYFLLNELFISELLFSYCDNLLKELEASLFDKIEEYRHLVGNLEKKIEATENGKKPPTGIAGLKDLMKKELQPEAANILSD